MNESFFSVNEQDKEELARFKILNEDDEYEKDEDTLDQDAI